MAERLNWTTNGNLYQQTSFTDADYSKMQNIIWTLQDPNNGGIHTGYTSTFENILSETDTNVETTSICLLHLTVPPPPLQYTLTPSADSHSSITPNTVQTKNYGESQTFTYSAKTGYHLNLVWLVDGSRCLGQVNPYQSLYLQQHSSISHD